jgi:hypothetical protein
MKMPGARYGRDLSGNPIQPRRGERILKEGEPLPERHRAWINGGGWGSLTKFLHKHPGANQTAQLFGNYWCYAAPIEDYVSEPQVTDEKPAEDVLVVPDVVSETPAVPAKRTKRKCEPRLTNEIEFD